MRVQVLCHDTSDTGGIQEFTRQMLSALDELGHEVSVTMLTNGRWRFALSAIRQAVARRPEIVFCSHVNLLPIAVPVSLVSGRRLGLLAYGKEFWNGLSRVSRVLCYATSAILAISERTETEVRNQLLGDRRRRGGGPAYLRLWPTFKPSLLSVPSGSRTKGEIVTVCRLVSADSFKGVDLLIAAVGELHRSSLESAPRLTVIGDGDDKDRLARLAADSVAAESIRFAGRVSDDSLAKLVGDAELFVLPSMEGFGIVLLEALALGTPVLAGEGYGPDDIAKRVPYCHLTGRSVEELACSIAALTNLDTLPHPVEVRKAVDDAFGNATFRASLQRAVSAVAKGGRQGDAPTTR